MLGDVQAPWDEVGLFITACLLSRDRDVAAELTAWHQAWLDTRPAEVPPPAANVTSELHVAVPTAAAQTVQPVRPRWRMPVAAGIAVLAVVAVTAGAIALTRTGNGSAADEVPVGLPTVGGSSVAAPVATATTAAPTPSSAGSPVLDPPDLPDPPIRTSKPPGRVRRGRRRPSPVLPARLSSSRNPRCCSTPPPGMAARRG